VFPQKNLARSLKLRAIEPHYYALASQLPAADPNVPNADVVVSTLSPHDRYLHLTGRDLRQTIRPAFDVYWSVADVCRQLFGDDRAAPDWVAKEMIEAIAMDWASADDWRFGVAALHVEHVVGVIDGQDCRRFLFAQATPMGTLFMPHLMRANNGMGEIRLPDFPLPFIFRVGQTSLDRTQLLSLRRGDVVRLMALAPRVLLGDTHLWNFRFNGDTLVIERNDDAKQDQGDHTLQSVGGVDGKVIGWDQLTMRCDFVLPTRPYRLAELDRMQEGTILPMDSRAISEVEMYVGKQVVAIGELVQIGEHIGFEVKRMLIKPGSLCEAVPRCERKPEL
jgi:flagellar motor switch/type III secretory pathway protein FliN